MALVSLFDNICVGGTPFPQRLKSPRFASAIVRLRDYTGVKRRYDRPGAPAPLFPVKDEGKPRDKEQHEENDHDRAA
jgi:hypothetical protein